MEIKVILGDITKLGSEVEVIVNAAMRLIKIWYLSFNEIRIAW